MSGHNIISNTFKSAMSYSFKKKGSYVGDDTFMYGKGAKDQSSEPKILSFKFFTEDRLLGPKTKELTVNSEHFQDIRLVANDGVIVESVGDDAAKETGIRPGDRVISVNGVCVISFSIEKIQEQIDKELRNSSKLKLTLRERESVQI